MLSEERKLLILKKVNENKSVTVQELKAYLNTSESTIRRAITDLNREGKLVKVYGGAIALEAKENAKELSVQEKEKINRQEKQRIAKYAASLIEKGDYVFIDSGTTTEYMIEYITQKDATYVTNAVSHAKNLARKGMKVLLIGGELKENTEAIVGADAILNIQKYHFTKGFFGTNGVSAKLGFSTPDIREAMIKKVAIENTLMGHRYILSDHDKFGKSSPVTFSDFGGTVVITDRKPDDIYMNMMDIRVSQENGI